MQDQGPIQVDLGTEKISPEVRQFIYDSIESAEQLEVLLFLREHREWWTAAAISQELRSSEPSILTRLQILHSMNLLAETTQDLPASYRYLPANPRLDELVGRVAETYKVHRQTILQLIFSPAKRARTFASAFVLKPPGGDGDDNG